MAPIKRLLVNLLLIGGGILLGGLMLEIGSRLFLVPPYGEAGWSFYACHDTLGWTGRPYYEETLKRAEFQQYVRFNSQGMHDTEHPVAKPPQTYRILMLGDSFTQGVQVAEADTAHQRLEEGLNEVTDSTQFEVISGGVINWGTNQQLLFYRTQGRYYDPDLVLLMVYLGNDWHDNLPGHRITSEGVNCYAPYFVVCDDQLHPAALKYAPGLSRRLDHCAAGSRWLAHSLGWLYQQSHLYQQLEPWLMADQPRRQFGQDYPATFSALYLPTDMAQVEPAWQVTLAVMAQLHQEVTADGSQLVVAAISPELIMRLYLLEPAERQQYLFNDPLFTQAEIDRPTQRLGDFLNGQGVPFIDLGPPLIEVWRQTGEPLYFLDDGHWTKAGHQAAADVLRAWLVKQGLLPLE